MRELRLLEQATADLNAEAAKHTKLVARAKRSGVVTMALTTIVEVRRRHVYANLGEGASGDHSVRGDAAATRRARVRRRADTPSAGKDFEGREMYGSYNSYADRASELTDSTVNYYLENAREIQLRLGPHLYGAETFTDVEAMLGIVSQSGFMASFAKLLKQKCDGADSRNAAIEYFPPPPTPPGD